MSQSLPKHIKLKKQDFRIATWRKIAPDKRPEPRPFDFDACVAQLEKRRSKYSWNWSRLKLPVSLTHEEAHFWVMAMAVSILRWNVKMDSP